MAIDLKARKAQLQRRFQELSGGAGSSEERDEEVRDTTDAAVADEEQDLVMGQESRDFEALREVREALGRIDAGLYGACEYCGREIEAARLDAIPETRYCIADARVRDTGATAATL